MDSTKKREFTVEVLPKRFVDQESLLDMATVLRDFRLEALRDAPDAFASTYEFEAQFPMGKWLQRLKNPNAWHIVATENWDRDGSDKARDNLTTSKGWSGLILVMAKSSFERESAATSPWTQHTAHISNKLDKQKSGSERIGVVSHYQLHSTFVHPLARRCGIGSELIQKALSLIKSMMTEHALPSVRIDVLVDSENIAAKSLYQSCGFQYVESGEYQVGGTKRIALSMSIEVHVDQEGY